MWKPTFYKRMYQPMSEVVKTQTRHQDTYPQKEGIPANVRIGQNTNPASRHSLPTRRHASQCQNWPKHKPCIQTLTSYKKACQPMSEVAKTQTLYPDTHFLQEGMPANVRSGQNTNPASRHSLATRRHASQYQ